MKNDSNPQTIFDNLFPPRDNELRLFTDGSKLAGLPFAGFAVFDTFNNTEHKYIW